MSERIFLKLNFDFIMAEIRGVFGSVGVYACVCVCVISRFFNLISVGFEIVTATVFLFCNGPILNDIRGHSDPKNICHIAGNRILIFQNFLG